MTKLTTREKYIAGGVGGAVLLLVLNQLILTPYTDKMNKLDTDIDDAQRVSANAAELFNRHPKLEKTWKQITEGGLESDTYQAQLKARQAIQEWAYAKGVNLKQLNTDRITDAKVFDVISFSVEVSGNTPSMWGFLTSFESAKAPIRIVDLSVQPTPEGSDNLTIHMNLSTLCLKQSEEKTTGGGVSLGESSSEDKSWN